jgi:O-antigen/teichoic acid export membrane protein
VRPLVRFGRRLGRDAGIYAAGFAVTLAISLVSVAILTRYLDPAEFGQLAVLLFFAALLTVLYNLGSLQGSLSWVFGSSGEEEANAAAQAEGPADRRRALGGAIVTTAAIAAVGTAVVAVAAGGLTSVLGLPGARQEVTIAAVSGGLGALWRLVSNVPRLERRPRLYVALSAVRPVLVLAVTVPLVASGRGATGAITGVAVGSALAVVVGLVAIRSSYRLSLQLADVRQILRAGLPFVPIVVSFWAIQNVDLYVLSKYASADDVGLYRLASRVAAVVSYFVSAFLMAWGPLTATSAFMAAAKEHGQAGVGGRLVTYYAIFGLGLVVGLTIAADLLVEIAPPSYSGAAGLIPILGAGFLAYGWFVVLYRAARFPGRRNAYAALAVVAAALFVASAIALTAAFDAYGAATAAIVAFAAGSLGIVWRSQRGPEPIPFEHRRIAMAVGLAAACIGVSRAAGSLPSEWGVAVDVAALVAYPALAVVLDIVPRRHLGALLHVASGLIPERTSSAMLLAGLGRLPPGERAVVTAVLGEGHSLVGAARRLAISQEEAERLLVRGVAALAGLSEPLDDPRIAPFLLSDRPVAERDAFARRLWDDGVDPEALDLLELACERMRSAPQRTWRNPSQPGRSAVLG